MSSNQNNFILLKMIDLAIKSMIENEDCYYCPIAINKNNRICANVDLCKSNLFNGLEQEAKRFYEEINKNGTKDFVE